MELSDLAGIVLQMSQRNNREGLSLMMIKQAAESQKQLVNMLESLTVQQTPDPRFNVSFYA
ncbi:hypothetical protein OR1_02252 [Geobacter sp. OR-1]|uniref:hypothetical protein n=1 Tax=Geobacter sp. OR-1 TaxID=1266765 RepID=UPI000543322F|nr:hypothetical protein [Geobacter sp. OR-1]GAM09967.1 hypothetical protein OR1_02252 [Geobacter sp. OR-1]